MDRYIVIIMAFFMTIGAIDKALFDSKYGYGKEFEKGLNAMGPMALVMVGIMCAAPAIGVFLAPIFSELFISIGSDPSLIAGMILGVDGGGLPLAKSLAIKPEAALLSGLGLAGTLGCIVTFSIPFSLSVSDEKGRTPIAKGLAIGVIASPFSMFGVAYIENYSFLTTFYIGLPAFVFSFLVALALIFFQDFTIKCFLLFAKILIAIFCILLSIAALENYFTIEIIPFMDPIGPQLTIVGQIGIMLAGAFPLILFIQRHLDSLLRFLSKILKIDEQATLGMIVSLANPLPMFMMLDKMSDSGKLICSAFAAPALCLLGDHLGYIVAAYPEGTQSLLVGKVTAAVIALGIALVLDRCSNYDDKQ